MSKLVLMFVAVFAIGASTSVRPAKSFEQAGQAVAASVGGGVKNPWRSPYKIV